MTLLQHVAIAEQTSLYSIPLNLPEQARMVKKLGTLADNRKVGSGPFFGRKTLR